MTQKVISHAMYSVTHQFGDYILLILTWLFGCLPYFANKTELAWHVGNMVELPIQSQQNIVADLMGHPVWQHNHGNGRSDKLLYC